MKSEYVNRAFNQVGDPNQIKGNHIPLDCVEEISPLEQHGFSIVDFTPDEIKIQMFKWDVKTQAVVDIESLQPFHTKVLSTKS